MSEERPEATEATIHWGAFRTLWSDGDVRSTKGRVGRIATIVAVSLWTLALGLVFLTWNGAAEHADVSLQLPYLVSGGLSALLLTLIGAAVLVWGVLAEAADVGTAAAADADVTDGAVASGRDEALAPVQSLRR